MPDGGVLHGSGTLLFAVGMWSPGGTLDPFWRSMVCWGHFLLWIFTVPASGHFRTHSHFYRNMCVGNSVLESISIMTRVNSQYCMQCSTMHFNTCCPVFPLISIENTYSKCESSLWSHCSGGMSERSDLPVFHLRAMQYPQFIKTYLTPKINVICHSLPIFRCVGACFFLRPSFFYYHLMILPVTYFLS